MSPYLKMILTPSASCPVKNAVMYLAGDRPWTVRRVRVLPDGSVEVILAR